jgi:hypothetical protein
MFTTFWLLASISESPTLQPSFRRSIFQSSKCWGLLGIMLICGLLISPSITSYRLTKINRPNQAKFSFSSASTIIEQKIDDSFEPTEALLRESRVKLERAPEDVDYVIVGSGIGGLSCAALLTFYGYSVVVCEAHYLPGSDISYHDSCEKKN